MFRNITGVLRQGIERAGEGIQHGVIDENRRANERIERLEQKLDSVKACIVKLSRGEKPLQDEINEIIQMPDEIDRADQTFGNADVVEVLSGLSQLAGELTGNTRLAGQGEGLARTRALESRLEQERVSLKKLLLDQLADRLTDEQSAKIAQIVAESPQAASSSHRGIIYYIGIRTKYRKSRKQYH